MLPVLSSPRSRRFLSWRHASLSAALALATSASASAPVQDIRAESPELTLGVVETVVLTPAADATVDSKYPTTNLGTQTYVASSPERSAGSSSWAAYEGFLRFDLSGLPRYARVLSARFTATAYQGMAYGTDENIYTSLVPDDSWSETEITWANRPVATGESLGDWRVQAGIGPWSAPRAGTLSTEELVGAVQGELAGDGQLSLRLSSPGFYSVYFSRESPYTQYHPRLEVTYEVVAPPNPCLNCRP
ncbi:DNRLRE domain-containing protein [Melittangium boletus]|uniref:DNRLRE domain-containing protein n=1 Tax=Melittangium boletus TaxID=83453 RepID=UPI003DA52B5B